VRFFTDDLVQGLLAFRVPEAFGELAEAAVSGNFVLLDGLGFDNEGGVTHLLASGRGGGDHRVGHQAFHRLTGNPLQLPSEVEGGFDSRSFR
jgi:hypothetical protein